MSQKKVSRFRDVCNWVCRLIPLWFRYLDTFFFVNLFKQWLLTIDIKTKVVPHVPRINMSKWLVIDRTPNPFGKSRTEPNRRFGRTEPSAKLGFPPKGSASGPNRFGLEAEPVRPSGRNPSQREGVPNSYGLRSFPTICSTLSGLFWLSVRHHSREKDGGGHAPIPPYYQGDGPIWVPALTQDPMTASVGAIFAVFWPFHAQLLFFFWIPNDM